jgi:UDP-glucuronate 4-epimerase
MQAQTPREPILVTGAAGFIGNSVALALIDRGEQVVGIDNLNDYYDPALKYARLDRLHGHPGFEFHQVEIGDRSQMEMLFDRVPFKRVVHLAAQAGVRYSITNPYAYVDSNIVGFLNILEGCRFAQTEHLVYASSSSVYGSNTKMPFSTGDSVDHPVSLYAATKKSNELMAHAYSHLYGIPTTGLRFFTVYGPWGRPDMALYLFTKAILNREPIRVFNYGKMQRDFTYIDDIVDGVVRVLDHVPLPNTVTESGSNGRESNSAPYKIYNIGNNRPIELGRLIEVLESEIGERAIVDLQPMQAGDVLATYAEISDLTRDVGFEPKTTIEFGVRQFVAWFREFYQM